VGVVPTVGMLVADGEIDGVGDEDPALVPDPHATMARRAKATTPQRSARAMVSG
jgi:hypothetical protein